MVFLSAAILGQQRGQGNERDVAPGKTADLLV
jgi:hypothetical protein